MYWTHTFFPWHWSEQSSLFLFPVEWEQYILTAAKVIQILAPWQGFTFFLQTLSQTDLAFLSLNSLHPLHRAQPAKPGSSKVWSCQQSLEFLTELPFLCLTLLFLQGAQLWCHHLSALPTNLTIPNANPFAWAVNELLKQDSKIIINNKREVLEPGSPEA